MENDGGVDGEAAGTSLFWVMRIWWAPRVVLPILVIHDR
jgi:hypothetical protein